MLFQMLGKCYLNIIFSCEDTSRKSCSSAFDVETHSDLKIKHHLGKMPISFESFTEIAKEYFF